jgi:hypothetical protein
MTLGGFVQKWNGSSWEWKIAQRWNGSAWEDRPLYMYTSDSDWIPTYTSGSGGAAPDYYVTDDTELTAVLALGSATLSGKTIAMSGSFGTRTITSLFPTTTVKFVALNSAVPPVWDRLSLASTGNIRFENIKFVSTVWSDSSSGPIRYSSGTYGAHHWQNCQFKGGYGGPGSTGLLYDNDYNCNTNYPEYACILPQFNDSGVVTSLIISRNNVAGLVSDGTHSLTFNNVSGVATFSVAPVCTMTVSGGIITGTTITSGGTSTATTAVNGSTGALSKVITWTGQAKMTLYTVPGVSCAGGLTFNALQSWDQCEFRDLDSAVSFSQSSDLSITNCMSDRIYRDHWVIPGSQGGNKSITIKDTISSRSFASGGDAGDPHSDFIQTWIPVGATADWTAPLIIERNIYYSGDTRGSTQGIFMESDDGYKYRNLRIVGNIVASTAMVNGLTCPHVENGYIYRNTIVRFNREDTARNISPILSSFSESGAEQCFFGSNISESISNDPAVASTGNIQVGLLGATIPYTSVFTSPPSDAGAPGSWPTTKAAILAAFAPLIAYAGKGAGGTDGYLDYVNETTDITKEPVFVDFADLLDQTLSGSSSSAWRLIVGSSTTGSISITNGTYQFADDSAGTGATSATSAPGTYTRGKYVRVNVTNASTGSTVTTATVTLTPSGGTSTVATFTSVTVSTATYPIVQFDETTPDTFRLSSSGVALGSDGATGTLALMRFKVPSIPAAEQHIFASNSGSARVQCSILSTTGRMRIRLRNAAGTVIANIDTAGSVCDDNYHDIIFSWNLDDPVSATGSYVYLDGASAKGGSSTWSGGSGVTVGYSHAVTLYPMGIVSSVSTVPIQLGALYLNIAAAVDITSALNRSKFDPANIGPTGKGPTGSQPLVFLTGTASQWNAAAGHNWGSCTAGTNSGKFAPVGSAAVTDVSGSRWPDYFVTTDAELSSAVTAATTGQIIVLSDTGTFSAQASIAGKTGITLRGQTYGVPHLQAGLIATTTTDCKILGLKITRLAPNSTSAYSTGGVLETSSSTNLEVAYCEISSNPLAGITMQDGSSGSLYFQGYRGINGSTAMTNFNFHNNYIHDTYRGHSVVGAASSVNYIENNTVIDSYQNPCEMACEAGGTIYYRHNDTMGTWAISSDPGSPHSSTLGFSASSAWTPIVVGNKMLSAVDRRFTAKGSYAAASGPKFNDPSGTSMNYVNAIFAWNICSAQDGIGLEISYGNFATFYNTVVKDNLSGSSLTPGLNYHDLGAGSYACKNIFPGYSLGASNVNGIHSDFIANSWDNVNAQPAGLGSVVSSDLNCYDFHFDGPTFNDLTLQNVVARLTPKAGSYYTSDGIGAIGTGYNWSTRSHGSYPTFTKPKTTNAAGTNPALTQFDGTNDWLQLSGSAPLLGMTNRRALTMAFYANFTGTDSTDCYYAESNGVDFTIRKYGTSGRIGYRYKNAGSTAICDINSSGIFTQLAANSSDVTKMLWVFSINMTTGRYFIMQGKELDPFPAVAQLKNDDIGNLRTSMAIMGQNDTSPPTGSGLLNGQLGLFYMTDEFVNLNTAANHNSIVATDGTPADWGASGSSFTGTQPRGYVKGNAAALSVGGGINLGSSAQKWVLTGTITDV